MPCQAKLDSTKLCYGMSQHPGRDNPRLQTSSAIVLLPFGELSFMTPGETSGLKGLALTRTFSDTIRDLLQKTQDLKKFLRSQIPDATINKTKQHKANGVPVGWML